MWFGQLLLPWTQPETFGCKQEATDEFCAETTHALCWRGRNVSFDMRVCDLCRT